MMQRTDLLLKIITAANGEPVTPLQLQKIAFLVGMQFQDELPPNYYQFQPYDYGPFCVAVYRDAEFLEREGLITIRRNPRGGWKEYFASYAAAAKDLHVIPQNIQEFVDRKVQWTREAGFQEVVRTIYKEYPQFKVNSVFQG